MHPSSSTTNVIRTISRHLVAGDLEGAAFFPDGDDRTPGLDVAKWVRLTASGLAGQYSGRLAGLRSTREALVLTLEVWCRGAADQAVQTVDQADQIADVLMDRLRYRGLPLLDLVTDPTGATPVSGTVIRFLSPPTKNRLPPQDGYQRRSVAAVATWFSRQE